MRSRKVDFTLLASTAVLGAALVAGPAHAHETTPSATAAAAAGTEPLYDNLGDLSYPVTTHHELAQRYFDQGLRWTYAFNHAAARRAFREAQRQDPACAMCFWGEALALGPNINAPMAQGAASPAVVAIKRAQALASEASAAERALIDALALRYSGDPKSDRAALDLAYAEAMGAAAGRFPGDHEIAVLYVDSLMNLSPWDYWEADGVTPKGLIGEAIAKAENVLAENPGHPGAIHLYIHLTEASATPERAEPYAERLPDLMPGAGHMVHMASHTYYRIGRFHDSAEVNRKAVAADEAYLAEVEDHGLWSNGYYPHNIHFTLTSALMAGDGATALAYADRLRGKVADEVAKEVGWIQAIMQAPYFAHAHFSEPGTILSLADPGDRFPFVKAMWHYARGVAFARQGDVTGARRAAAKIADINQDAGLSYPPDIDFVVGDVLRIARHVVEGRIAQAEGDHARAVREFEVAVQIQDSLFYMEPPFWYYPVRQSLGAALVASGRPAEAEAVFAKSLENVPNNGWALFGLMEAQKAQGKDLAAAQTGQRFEDAWSGETAGLVLARL